MATSFQTIGTGKAAGVSFIGAFVPASGAATNVIGGIITAAWDSDASCVLTYDAFKVAPQIHISQNSGGTQGDYMLTGVGVTTAGVRCLLSGASVASAADFTVLIFGLSNR